MIDKNGLKNEQKFSLEFHQEGIPLLVSPKILRIRDMGQIDLARIIKNRGEWLIEIGEVKSSSVGEYQMEKCQIRRLFSSQHFLAGLFGHRTKLIRLIKKEKSFLSQDFKSRV